MRKYLILILLLISAYLQATHNRAGEITFEHISGLTYKINVVTYTYTPSPADRPELDVNWGDGTTTTIYRFSKTNLSNDISVNLYNGQHTFAGNGTYIISIEDPNRNGGVINIPYSINVPFYIQTELVINPFLGNNNSPVLLNPPVDEACVSHPFYHNPGAFDPDGDSLSYEITECRGESGNIISGYSYPQASNSFSIDPVTGTLTWDSPMSVGEYNIAILIKEWRNGMMISSVTRDMQVSVVSCNNDPPEITTIADTCVMVGEQLSFNVSAIDINNDYIDLTATGGPLILSNTPASFANTGGTGYVSSTFYWQPSCDNVRLNPYQMIFKAKDNGIPIGLIDLKTVNITVVAPPPDTLLVSPQGNTMDLVWSKSHCENAVGYDIYRHNGFINYQANTCETGVPPWTGYQKIGSTNSVNDTTYIDDSGLIPGPQYCYMVVAVFDDGAESYPSHEACAKLIKDVPVITHVTIDSTSATDGKITTIWSKPTQIDTIQTPGPYKYLIYHKEENGSFNLIDSLDNLNDTIYQVSGINTLDNQHYIRIDFYNDETGNRFKVGETYEASSVYLNIAPSDNMLELIWDTDVPWTNDTIIVYKEDFNGNFDSIGFTTDTIYQDSNLVNGNEYCYFIKTKGSYSGSGFINPIINLSQKKCAVPEDVTPPCAPKLDVVVNCEFIENYIYWTNPNNHCVANDVVGYDLYYRKSPDDDFTNIYSTSDRDDTSFVHMLQNTIAGCYIVSAVDSFDNRSEYSNEVCVDIDSCDFYRLPNVFTPNGDGSNDMLNPFPYDFVERVDMKIFNRWGTLVYKTEDPDINWDGKNISTKNDCSDGVYFYVCLVYERRLEGIVEREIHGSVTIIR